MSSTDRDLFAAVDLGSNSFHLIVARLEQGQVQVIDRIRDMVRLAGGLNKHGQLEPEVREKSLASLARFGQRIAAVPSWQIRAVGTQTFRRMANPAAFLVVAETALGQPIDIIGGREEARLIYLGVSQGMAPADARRLVIDIGGGSTEIVVGESLDATHAESLPVGCVSLTRKAFANGRISAARWQSARQDILAELQPYAAQFQQYGWTQAVGSSGTVRAVSAMISARDPGIAATIRPDDLARIKARVIEAGHIDRIDLPGLSESRRPVIAGGVLILEALMSALGIDQLEVSSFALREGLLHELVGRLEQRDPRERTVRTMAERYQVDAAQATRITDWVGTALEQVSENWSLNPPYAELLHWTCQLHEIGLAIAHDHYPEHSAYILEHADMPGFGRLEQQLMATVAGLQRGRIDSRRLDRLPDRLQRPACRMLALLRLATTVFRARSDAQSCDFALISNDQRLELQLPPTWLARHPLTRRDLAMERKQLKKVAIDFRCTTLETPPQ